MTTDRVQIGPLGIMRLTAPEAVQLIETAVDRKEQMKIAICNAHTLLSAVDDPAYAQTLNSMTVLNDGVGMDKASIALLGEPFPENLNGTDFVPYLLENASRPLRIFLFGAKQASVEGAAGEIRSRYPRHELVGFRNGYFAEQEIGEICASISATQPDLLLVAMGNPKQEYFIAKHGAEMGASVSIGVGALFDFLSGSVVRAPLFMRKLKLEWLFRLAQEPRRLFHRYVVGIPRFLLYVRKLRKSANKA